MTVKEYRDKGVEKLMPLYPKEEAKALLDMVLEHFCRLPLHLYYTDPDRLLPPECLPDLQKALYDLLKARPIQYIVGKTLFEGCTIMVREGVLIPRPETAELVRWAKDVATSAPPSLRLLDLCTGSGAIAIALAKTLPQAKVVGIDISAEALEIAQENSRLNRVEVDFLRADILQSPTLEPPLLPHSFDLLLSNPPYVRLSEKAYMHPKVLDYEPHSALFVPDHDPLLFYRALADWGVTLLKEGGLLMAEINEQMGKEVEALWNNTGYTSVQLRTDLNGKPRMIAAVHSPIFSYICRQI